MTAPDDEYSSEESDRESLADIVGQELESLLPFRDKFRRGLQQLGGMFVLGGLVLARGVQPPFSLNAVAYQVEALGARSLSIATLTAIFAGLVISLQFAFFLARFGVQHTVGKVVVLTLFRELGPVLTALTVGARIGSGIAAELGSMKVTEQIDAIRALGADPIKKLVGARGVLACMLVLPALTVLADVFGLVAGALVVESCSTASPLEQFYRSVRRDRDDARLRLGRRQERGLRLHHRDRRLLQGLHRRGRHRGRGPRDHRDGGHRLGRRLPRGLLPHQAASSPL